MAEPWWGVWAMRDGYVGHWHGSGVVVGVAEAPLQTTRTEAERVCMALNTFTQERTDSLGWSYEVRPYPERSEAKAE